jgi:hypothetical protein
VVAVALLLAQTCHRPPIEVALSQLPFWTPSYASRASVALRHDNHTKVYCGRSEEVTRPHARLMEEPTQNGGLYHAAEALLRTCAQFGRASHMAGVSCAITI